MMRARTQMVSDLLALSGASRLRALTLNVCPSRQLRILAYHRILENPSADFPYDADLISASPEAFDREMAFIARRFDVITFRDLETENVASLRNPLILSFDDGYKDNITHAYPVLQRHGLRATFFVSTGFVGTGCVPWWDEIAYLAKRAALPNAAAVVGECLRQAKCCTSAGLEALLVRLREQSGLARPVDPALFMDWDDLRILLHGGMEIGSHTVTHPVMSCLDNDGDIRSELTQSRIHIERELGTPPLAFCYPVEGSARINAALRQSVGDAGYRYACCYEHGINELPLGDPLCMKRIKAELRGDFRRFVNKVLFPRLIRY